MWYEMYMVVRFMIICFYYPLNWRKSKLIPVEILTNKLINFSGEEGLD